MKILLINDHVRPIGGAEVLMNSFAKELKGRGHQVRLLTSNAWESKISADYTCHGTTRFYTPLLQVCNLSAIQKLKIALREFQPEVVHVQLFLTQLSPFILPLLKNIPTVYYAVWYRAICPTGTKLLPNGKQCEFRFGTACLKHKCLPAHDWLPIMGQLHFLQRQKNVFNKVIVPSVGVQNYLKQNGFQVDGIIEHGVNARAIPKVPKTENPTIAFCGRLVQSKGAHIIICAFKNVIQKLPNARLFIIGDGPEKANLEKQAASLGLATAVSFFGYLPFEKCEEELAKSWVQVVPSLWVEPFGLVVLDAMFRGTPVIASNLGGPSQLIDSDETGFLVLPHDIKAWTETLLQLLTNDNLREHVSQKAQKVAHKRLTIEHFTDCFIDLFKNLIVKTNTDFVLKTD